ncbi:MAG: AMP-binding protein [Ideonella sp.]|nr:AMP-binding protein [Ideonella sp.]
MTSPDQNVYQAFSSRFPADGNRLFIEGFDGRRVSYGEVDAITARMANALAAAGVRKGDRVAGVLEKSPEGVLLYLSVCRMGGVYMPVSTGLTPVEVAYVIKDSVPRVVVCDPSWMDHVGHGRSEAHLAVLTLDTTGGGSFMDACAAQSSQFATAQGQGNDPNSIVYTSGTTGQPKGAILTNGLVIWNAIALSDTWKITHADVLLHANPMAFGLFGTTTPVVANGAAMLLLPKFDAQHVIEALPRATMFAGVPTYYTRLLDKPAFDRNVCRGMRLFITGSAPMRADVFAEFTERTGHVLLDRYGLTEALLVTSNLVDDQRRANTSGLPLSGSKLRVLDEQRKSVKPGEVGNIEVWQPWMFAGYLHAPEKTRAALTEDGWFITGDFGRVDERGYVTVLGRGTDLIISGGFNVYPKEVETCINRLPNVVESAVVGVPHRDLGEAVVAVIELKDKSAAFDTAAATAALKKKLAGYKVPKRIVVIDEMPRNTLGKIQKKLLKGRFSA